MIDSITRGFWTLLLGLGLILTGGLLSAGATVMEVEGDQGRFGQTLMSTSGTGLVIAGAITLGLALSALLAFREDAETRPIRRPGGGSDRPPCARQLPSRRWAASRVFARR